MERDVEMEDVEHKYYQPEERKYNQELMNENKEKLSEESEPEDNENEFLKGQNNDNLKTVSSNLIIRSKKNSLRYLEQCEAEGIDPSDEKEQDRSKREDDHVIYKQNIQKVRELTEVITQLILKLSNFTSMYVGTKFFYEQYDTVMNMLERFIYNENQSMLLLSRSNTVLHQFISKIRKDLSWKLKQENIQWDVRTVRINSILTTKETAILNHFAEWLGMDNTDKQTLAFDMKSRMEEFFKQRPGISVLFILENVEYYVENSKQSLLYKILDMLQYTKIKFAFIATSQKIDIIDNFEKRIRSRFSHRQILFYSEDLETFKDWINDTIKSIGDQFKSYKDGLKPIEVLHKFITEPEFGWMKIFEKLFEKGKDYEFLCRTLKIALSHLNSTYKSEPWRISTFEENGGELFRKSLDYVENLSTSNDFKTILSKMPEAYLLVLISGKNVSITGEVQFFTFSLAYKEYLLFVKRGDGKVLNISKETFIKIFIDLVQKGFFRSKAASDIISVNNKVVLGIPKDELTLMIEEKIKNNKDISTFIQIYNENKAHHKN